MEAFEGESDTVFQEPDIFIYDVSQDENLKIPERDNTTSPIIVGRGEQDDPRLNLTKDEIVQCRILFREFYEEHVRIANMRKPQKKKLKKDVLKIPVFYVSRSLRRLGKYRTNANIQKMVQDIDPENTGQIDFNSFLLPIAKTLKDEPITRQQLIEAFKVINSKNQTALQINDFLAQLMTLGEPFDVQEAAYFLKALDPKNKGLFDWMKMINRFAPLPKGKKWKDAKKKK